MAEHLHKKSSTSAQYEVNRKLRICDDVMVTQILCQTAGLCTADDDLAESKSISVVLD